MKTLRYPLLIFFGLAILVFGLYNIGRAQISTHESPLSIKDSLKYKGSIHTNQSIQVIEMPELDTLALSKEDIIRDQKALPFRFGFSFPVKINLDNSGSWDTLENGTKLWRLRIHLAKGARSISFTYDHFFLPVGCKLFIYSENKKQVLGAFTSINNKGGSGKNAAEFATAFIYGRFAVLELVLPNNTADKPIISINQVIHGYRSIITPDSFTGNPSTATNPNNFASGQSLPCEININCSAGSGYQNEKRAVSVYTLGGYACTGSLVQNTARNSSPYFLTANHCLNNQYDAAGNTNMGTALFYWNYESPTCTNSYPSVPGTTGATLLANALATDFALFKLTEDPASVSGINPYYLEWSRTTVGASSAADISHPKADIKKIALSTNSVSSYASPLAWPADGADPANTTAANTHWAVSWSNGTTESGSSGSALLDQNHFLVGQLHGSNGAGCSPSNISYYFGRFDLSWTGDGTNGRSLKSWLDPLGTNPISSLNLSISGPTSFCTNATYTMNGVPSGSTVNWAISPTNSNVTLSASGNQVYISYYTASQITFTLTGTVNGATASLPVTANSNYLSGTYSNGSTNGTLNTFNYVPTGYTNGYFNWPNVSNISVTGSGSGSSFYWNGGSSFSFYLSAGQNMTVKFNGLSSCGSTSPVNIMATRTFQASSSFSLAVSPNPSSTKLSLSITSQPDTTGKLMMAQKAATNTNAELSSINSTKVLLYDLSLGTLVKAWNFSENVSSNYSLDVSGLKRGYYVLKMSRDNQTVSTNIQIQ